MSLYVGCIVVRQQCEASYLLEVFRKPLQWRKTIVASDYSTKKQLIMQIKPFSISCSLYVLSVTPLSRTGP